MDIRCELALYFWVVLILIFMGYMFVFLLVCQKNYIKGFYYIGYLFSFTVT